jgi:parallel beta-helix repeat protein
LTCRSRRILKVRPQPLVEREDRLRTNKGQQMFSRSSRWAASVVAGLCWFTVVRSGQAEILHVPSEYPEIQYAISAAVDGDIVEVAAGIYTGVLDKNLKFNGKAITVRSASGNPADCVIDCQGSGRGFYFYNGEMGDSVVVGITIVNGYVDASVSGGAFGGGIFCTNSGPTIRNCIIASCSAEDSGGGVFCYQANPTIIGCEFRSNVADRQGGGLYTELANPSLSHCVFRENFAPQRGGGLYSYESFLTVENCVFRENRCGDEGGGISVRHSTEIHLTNCTMVRNEAPHGDAISANSDDQIDPNGLIITNCIIWDHSNSIWNNDDSLVIASYSDIQHGWPGVGNLDVEPGFAFADDYHLMPSSACVDAGTNEPPGGLPHADLDGNPRSLDGDGDLVSRADMGAFEFNPAQPAIALLPDELHFEASFEGDNPPTQTFSLRNAGAGTLAWEVDGDPDWLTVDPASGESTGEIDGVTLSVNVAGLPPGTYEAVLAVRDANATNSPRHVYIDLEITRKLRVPGDFLHIQDAIDAAVDGDVILIAPGTYLDERDKNLDFAGKAIVVRGEAEDPTVCTIDCSGDGNGFIFDDGEDADAVVEYLTIRGGTGYPKPDYFGYTFGGAIYCDASSPTIRHCVLMDSWSDYEGGAIYCSSRSDARVLFCTMVNNTAGGDGGGIYVDEYSSPIFANCIVSNNEGFFGGAVAVRALATPVFANCLFSNNEATRYAGGALCWSGSDIVFTNCTFYGNGADAGGALYGGAASTPILTNCILWNDHPEEIVELMANVTVRYSDVMFGWPGEENLGADPVFVDPDGPDGDPFTWQDNDFRLDTGSPCVDAGNNHYVPIDELDLDDNNIRTERLPLDLAGGPRFLDDPLADDTGMPDLPGYPAIVDMGPFERHPLSPADLDHDGDVDLDDYDLFTGCLLGNEVPVEPGCEPADLDDDGDCDVVDFAWFTRFFTGP